MPGRHELAWTVWHPEELGVVDTPPHLELAVTATLDCKLSSMNPATLLIRPSIDADLPAITAAYGWNVQHGTGTFELEAPDEAEMARRRADVLSKGLPWLVAERGGEVLGYAYANHFRPRRAYRFCLEDSIYLGGSALGQGIGKLLLAELLSQCEAAGARQMLAVIGDSSNAGSIGVHRALGFEHTGLMKSAGWKFGRWLDVVLMQRSLGQGDNADPLDAV